MALIAQPFRHPDSGIYYLRRRVPDDIRLVIGKTEIRRSLNTRNHQEAKATFAIAYAESERFFQQVRSGHSCLIPSPRFNPFPIPTCTHTTTASESESSPTRKPLRLSEEFLGYVESPDLERELNSQQS
ncbi:DUF6538 domain-containing protein [Pseudomonas atacamensis]|uniref:DUF6538 domain-containing protein n=1 Tax=Pseudomonas atacamensis TaxID=2565368 RepID=UPI0036F2CBE3